MSFKCKNVCGQKQDVEWKFIRTAWLPVVTVCSLEWAAEPCIAESACLEYLRSEYTWDACFENKITQIDGNITGLNDLIENLELMPLNDGKEPSLITSENGGQEFNMISFNGINQQLSTFLPLTSFTIIMVVNNFNENLSENVGAFFSICSDPFVEQVLCGYTNNTIVISQDDGEGGLINLIENEITNGFKIIAVRVNASESSLDLFVNGGEAENITFDYTVSLEAEIALLFGSSFVDYCLNGEIGWISYYNSAISNAELNRAIAFAAQRFNINYTSVS